MNQESCLFFLTADKILAFSDQIMKQYDFKKKPSLVVNVKGQFTFDIAPL